MALAAYFPHGAGSNHANDPAPDVPIDPVHVEDPDAFRRRMQEKADRQRPFIEGTVKGTTALAAARRDPDLEHARYTTPDQPAADPAPIRARTAPRPWPTDTERLDWVRQHVEQGRSVAHIAAAAGRSESTIRAALSKAGVPASRARTKTTGG